jgi:hypothetical protein
MFLVRFQLVCPTADYAVKGSVFVAEWLPLQPSSLPPSTKDLPKVAMALRFRLRVSPVLMSGIDDMHGRKDLLQLRSKGLQACPTGIRRLLC